MPVGFGRPGPKRKKELEEKSKKLHETIKKEKETGVAKGGKKPKQDNGFFGHPNPPGVKMDKVSLKQGVAQTLF